VETVAVGRREEEAIESNQQFLPVPSLFLQFFDAVKSLAIGSSNMASFGKGLMKLPGGKGLGTLGTKGDDDVLTSEFLEDALGYGRRDFLTEIFARGGINELGDGKEPNLEVVAQFGHGTDGRTRGPHGVALLDSDGGANVFDLVHPWPGQGFEKLAYIGAEGLDVAPLTFGMEHLEEERRFTCPAEPRDHDEFTRRQFEIETLQVVLTDAAEANLVHRTFQGKWANLTHGGVMASEALLS